MSKPFSRPVSHVASRMMVDDTKQQRHPTDVEMASRVLRAWETMARRLDELSRSTDGGRPTGAVGPQKYAEPPMDISGLMISTPQEPVARYPCPFRKRNPVRFNIRDHESCAKTPFDSILDLRRHIVSYHRHRYPPRQCRRCKANFESQAALWSHMMLPKDQMCELDPTQVGDPEDGISDEQASHLCENNPKADWSWERIWHLVFPEDVQVTDPDWQPIIELSEIDQAFEDNEEELKKDLKKSLRLFLPEELQDDYCGFVAGQLELVFQTHRAYVIRQCINRLDATQNPYKTDASQQTAARRSTRRSRQSSMLQSSKTLSVIGTRTPNRFSTDSSNQRRHHRVASTPPPPNDSYDTSSTSPTLIDEDDDHTVGRDSGIGISCHICGREACICTSTLATHQENRVVYETEQDYWPLSSRKNERKASMEVRGRYLRRQPDRASLRVRVGDDIEPFRGETGSGSEDGRFSPQSFKQRVMRREVHVESGI
ncbi:hypothetical protein QBC42DRAFT_258178 [Cladorrhinum samala]|uniref:C2H2-type domain-containing protein n=1 Tax=Cladorrhinum samala TaxID=585594 RepID=A0AAV9I2E0_9PEZI|nr:hypothetical protein QBC42DRAFT_258178 [Cladorrhinum samala]